MAQVLFLSVVVLVECSFVFAINAPKQCLYVLINNDTMVDTDNYKVPNFCYIDTTNNPQNGMVTAANPYIYECNASNADYFVKKQWHFDVEKANYSNPLGCYLMPPNDIIYYHREDGYDFNCGEQAMNCSAVDLYAPNQYFQYDSYIAGGCFRNLNESASVQYVCSDEIGIIQIAYKSNDCFNSSNAVNVSKTYVGPNWNKEIVECIMP